MLTEKPGGEQQSSGCHPYPLALIILCVLIVGSHDFLSECFLWQWKQSSAYKKAGEGPGKSLSVGAVLSLIPSHDMILSEVFSTLFP